MQFRSGRTARKVMCFAGTVALFAAAVPVYAQSAILDDLLLKLKEKGVLSADEYEALKAARDEERTEQRAERRRQALKEAQTAEKEEKAKDTAASSTKFTSSASIKSAQLYGDVRVRYESRVGDGVNGTGSAREQSRERERYAARIGLRGDLTDSWYYGLRIETSINPRSSWATFGDDTTASPGAKDNDRIALGQAYLGWNAMPWLALEAGRMPNPFFNSSVMVWDPDIMVEGLAEKLKFNVNDRLTVFGNFAQMVYQDNATDSTSSVEIGFHSNDVYILGWQGGAAYKFTPNVTLRGGLTFYNYNGRPDSSVNLGKPFSGQPGGNQVGINNLQIVDVPVELTFPLFGKNMRVYADYATNLDADERARRAGFAQYGGEDQAYQFGLAYGELKKKNDWQILAYWQHAEQYALDPNLTDSDWFDGRTNMEGWSVGAGYAFTDAILGILRYGEAKRVNKALGTGGSSDLTGLARLDDFKLLQLDLIWRF